jgi:hypothetical protein
MLFMRGLEVLEVLLQGRLVELGEELGAHREVKTADIIDQLTFIHDGFTFRGASDTGEKDWRAKRRESAAGPIEEIGHPPGVS